MKTLGFMRRAMALLFIFCVPGIANAQSGWTLDVGAERSDVTYHDSDSIWWSQHLNVGWTDEQTGGWFAGVEYQDRFGLQDVVIHTNAYRRLGDWTLGAGTGFTPDADFWFRSSFESEISRRIVGSLVASGAYRFMQFPNTKVYQPQIALAWYHSRGEIQARVFLTRNAVREGYTATGLLQSSLRIAPRLQLMAAVARGDRIFDMESLAHDRATAWVVHGTIRIGISQHFAVDIGGGFAREKPQFEQQTLALSMRIIL